MIWNNKYIYPRSSRSIINGVRNYMIGSEMLPSVTSVLSNTKSSEELASLKLWEQRLGDKAKEIKKEASDRGNALHSYVENYLKGRLNESFFENNEQYKKMANEIITKGIKGRLSEIWGVECNLYFPNKYAGQSDIIGVYDGEPTIIDLKQTNKVKKQDWIQDYYLQISAYSLAHNEVFKTNIKQAVILMCSTDYIYQEFKIQNEVLEMYQNLFLGRLKKFNEKFPNN